VSKLIIYGNRNAKTIFLSPLELMDYPESDEDTGMQTEALETGNSILDSEDADMGSGNMLLGSAGSGVDVGCSASLPAPTTGNTKTDHPARGTALSEGTSRKRSGYSTTSERLGGDGPDLPPIYLTVRKEREKKMVTHNLFGDGDSGTGSTVHGAPVSKIDIIGSFANAGDRRHNLTSHRFDFKNIRNLSTSFDTSTLKCTTCQQEHTVLRREIEGNDVGLDIPPVFVLSDQNFPSMIPAGGTGTVPV
jgi:hypothetical protein